MQQVYSLNNDDTRKLNFLYNKSGINTRYSTIVDYSVEQNKWEFYPKSIKNENFPSLEKRMQWYQYHAAKLSVNAINDCINTYEVASDITHLITVSCTGMSAPGLDLEIIELMNLPRSIYRTSVNFMGCYAAIHALKMADAICKNECNAKVVIVCTELCTLHFQNEATEDNLTASMLFSDGAAAVLVTADSNSNKGLFLKGFYSEVIPNGKKDMSWQLSSSGFLMTLSGYVPNLIEKDFEQLVTNALQKNDVDIKSISHWCIHPGGKRILDTICKSLKLNNSELNESYDVLKNYGNMSSPTILFVLKNIMHSLESNAYKNENKNIFGAAFGPGLTMETFIVTPNA